MLELEDVLIEKGKEDGIGYAKNAKYLELRLIEKMVDSLRDFQAAEVDANTLATTACDADRSDQETWEWIDTNLSKRWFDEEPYIWGFIYGIQEILEKVAASNGIDSNIS